MVRSDNPLKTNDQTFNIMTIMQIWFKSGTDLPPPIHALDLDPYPFDFEGGRGAKPRAHRG